MSPEHLVFVDETWAKTNMARCYGRAPRGRRLVAAVPHGHWKTSTFLAGLRRDGITAPCVLDGPINGRSFRAPRQPAGCRPSGKRIIRLLADDGSSSSWRQPSGTGMSSSSTT